jgi:putative cardiolipin synthase
MGDWFDQNIERIGFRLELYTDETGHGGIRWHGLEDGKPRVFHAEPYTSFWRRFGIGFIGILPIESQL